MSRTGQIFSAIFIGVLAVAAVFPGVLAPGNPLAVDPAAAFSSPSVDHPLGTDESGRDIYTRIIHGTADSLQIGLLATALGMSVALVLGSLAALGPRWIDQAILAVLETLYAVPALLLALIIIAFTGPGPEPAIIAVGCSTAPGYARLIRSQIRILRGSEMMEAATVLGRGPVRKTVNHLIPNALRTLMVLVTLGIGQAVVWASALSFLGLGTPPPAPEWGAMLASGRTYLNLAWWMTVFPGLAIVVVAAGATLIGRGIGAGSAHSSGKVTL
ncbi:MULTISPECIES: ABC transporter permease [Auritidibacter]|uniref:ABC transporter permease n=1 Tax=Auritidibacter ignavus TaxID=678932 RepID=A0AAJ6DCQ5_9MICC|nr:MULTISPECIES: ABC transporter permease [Auritidibacter]AXR73520.1 ABC transporter permease [Auritidibacter sp. NML130574]NIH70661.1 peptide/nickel transport system permease protein [Auritidibacter ignavus]RMX23211.1 ABC transporter permease [Auritidibacter ignavus]WGH84366.1 ABC transporter permease [Auritidibacter ignavus]WGH93689.1 ABC transporter permease [Auritidibacter ignavus]